jgi:hypothetical protein
MPGKTVADYQITNMGEELTLGTFCHENGHMVCSFPDLYDFQRNSHGVGAFCLMCNGLDVDQKNPTQINAYLKFQGGWADSVTNITPGLNASVRAGVNDFFILRKNQTEYFIIENRQQTGRDQALRASGLAIWHVDDIMNARSSKPMENLILNVSNPTSRSVTRTICFMVAVTRGSAMTLIQTAAGGTVHRPD